MIISKKQLPHHKKQLWEIRPICFVCNDHIDDFNDCTLEHIIPRSKGGTNEETNLSISHAICNCIKSDLIFRHDWERKLTLRKDALTSLKTQKLSLRQSTRPIYEIEYFDIWGIEINIVLIKEILKTHFSDLNIMKKIASIKQPSEFNLDLSTKEISLQIYNIIMVLKKCSTVEELIEFSSILDDRNTASGWKMIFAALFLDRYIKDTEYNHCLIHAIWRLEQLHKSDFKFSQSTELNLLMDECFDMDWETYRAVTSLFSKKTSQNIIQDTLASTEVCVT